MSKKSAKIEKILDVSIEVLRQEGDFGVSMRKVATLAEMSLSNVQYYFKNKDELLRAMADRYFQQCLDELAEQPELSDASELKNFISAQLSHVYQVSDMCRIFREYWAISTRNEAIDAYLLAYYQSMASSLNKIFKPLAKDNVSVERAISVFIPFVEGYSITARALPVDLEHITQSISSIVLIQLTGQ
ncbi:TetR/AcrR family transcriptional regulator [Vibrio alginolyticus]|nr:TetR/AcrR family transcriptional regulator [Vibrio alginolyticus]ELB2831639.1 TetR/AcrR family transcriptional regulator [Vibrio alginolyticus]